MEDMKQALVKIRLKQIHPKGMMAHGRHYVKKESQELMFNADEMQALKGKGPKHWFEFKVLKEISSKQQKELDAMRRQRDEEDAAKTKADQESKELADMAEQERLELLEKEALVNQQQEDAALKEEQEAAANAIKNENGQGE